MTSPLSDADLQSTRTVITTALAKLVVDIAPADLDALVEAVDPLVMSNISTGVAGDPLVRQSWRELYDREHAENVRLHKYATIVADLDRCEHGRHEGDVCSSCNGPSKGNPLLELLLDDDSAEPPQRVRRRFGEWSDIPDRLIGFGLDASPICVPTRERMREIAHVEQRAITADDYYRRDLR